MTDSTAANSPVLNESITQAIQEKLAYSTIPILEDPPTPEHGTGAAVQYNGRYFIVTAAHVIGTAKKLRYLSRPNVPLVNVGRTRELGSAILLGKGVGSGPARPLIFKAVYPHTPADVAVIELDPSTAQVMPNVRFIELPSLDYTTPHTGTRVFLMGFAEEAAQLVRHRPTGITGKLLNLYSDSPSIVNNRELGDFDGRFHFLMDYPYDPAESARPHGLSGCGVWQISDQQLGGVWSLGNPTLIGVQTHWYPSVDLLKAARIEIILSLIRGESGNRGQALISPGNSDGTG